MINEKKIDQLILYNIEKYINKEEENRFSWLIFDKGKKRIGEFEFLWDEHQRLWLNNCSVDEDYQQKGIGTSVIKHAVKVFDALYFCTASKEELIGGGKEYDSRYLTEEGVILMESCLRNKIIKSDWAIKPF